MAKLVQSTGSASQNRLLSFAQLPSAFCSERSFFARSFFQ